MTEQKWTKIFNEEADKLNVELARISTGLVDIKPAQWASYKTVLTNFINEVDQSTEVYEMENKGASNGNQK